MASFYTPSIEHVGLRHAIIACASYHLNTGNPVLQIQHVIQELRQSQTFPRRRKSHRSPPSECVSIAEIFKIRSKTPIIIIGCRGVLIGEINQLLQILLEAPFIVEGLISSEGIDAGISIAAHFFTQGDTLFLNDNSCEVYEEGRNWSVPSILEASF